MKNILDKIVWLVIFVPVIFLAITWDRLPETVALHFDFHGKPDRYGSKRELIGVAVILIAVNIFVWFLLTNIYRIDPKKYAAENRDRLRRIAFAVTIFISALLCLIINSSIKENAPLSTSLIFSGAGLLFAVIGNYMPNMKPNYFAGFRVPWTLESETNWKRTHAVGGRLWFAGGIILAVVCPFLPPVAAIVFFGIVMLALVIIPFVVSYKLYKKEKSENLTQKQ